MHNFNAASRAETEQTTAELKNVVNCASQETQQVLNNVHGNEQEIVRMANNVQHIEGDSQNVFHRIQQLLADAERSAANAAQYEQVAQQNAHANSGGGGGGGVVHDIIDGVKGVLPFVAPFFL